MIYETDVTQGHQAAIDSNTAGRGVAMATNATNLTGHNFGVALEDAGETQAPFLAATFVSAPY